MARIDCGHCITVGDCNASGECEHPPHTPGKRCGREIFERWRVGPMLWARNHWLTMAYAVDDSRVEQFGIGPDCETVVLFISTEHGKLWDGCEERAA